MSFAPMIADIGIEVVNLTVCLWATSKSHRIIWNANLCVDKKPMDSCWKCSPLGVWWILRTLVCLEDSRCVYGNGLKWDLRIICRGTDKPLWHILTFTCKSNWDFIGLEHLCSPNTWVFNFRLENIYSKLCWSSHHDSQGNIIHTTW